MPLDAVTQDHCTDADNLCAAADGDGTGISYTESISSISVVTGLDIGSSGL